MPQDERTTNGKGRYQTAQAVVVALLVVGLLAAIFIFQNTSPTEVHFFAWSATVPLSGALILAAVLGGILAFLVAYMRQRRIAREPRPHSSKADADAKAPDDKAPS
jgi:uncharacterized integral membrane protein